MKRAYAQGGGVVVLDVPEPELRAGEILVAPTYSAISSGTETHIISSTARPETTGTDNYPVATGAPMGIRALRRAQTIVARVGFGAGEEVAEGRWAAAKELTVTAGRRRRSRILAPQARLAALLGAREAVLASEELTLRARSDVDQNRPREAALQLLVALDAALAELGAGPQAGELSARIEELR